MTRIYALPETLDDGGVTSAVVTTPGGGPGAVEAFARIRLAAQTVPEVFEAWLLCRSSVCGVWSIAGDFDYEVRLVCATPGDLAAEVRAIRRFGADETDTCLLLREVEARTSMYHGGD
jgi:hypothetical protein